MNNKEIHSSRNSGVTQNLGLDIIETHRNIFYRLGSTILFNKKVLHSGRLGAGKYPGEINNAIANFRGFFFVCSNVLYMPEREAAFIFLKQLKRICSRLCCPAKIELEFKCVGTRLRQ
jgi:hypothetical protein